MKKQHITSINEENINIADKYIKKVIINTRNAYFKNKSQLNKQGIIFLNIESYEDFLASNDDNFEELYCCYINENGFKIPVKNTQLAEAILCLTDKQRSIILRNVVLNIPLSKIAISLGISKRMAEKHKQKAMKILRERMKTSNGEY